MNSNYRAPLSFDEGVFNCPNSELENHDLLNKTTEVNQMILDKLSKINAVRQSNNNIKDEIDLVEKEIETLKLNLNEDKIAEFAVNLKALIVRVNENTKALRSQLEERQQLKENLTKQMEEQEPLMKLIENVDFNNMNDDELLETICASNINLDYLLENEVDAPPLPPSNDKKLEDQKTLKSLIEGSLKNLDNMDRITEDYQKEDDFIVKTHEIKTQPITDEQRNNLNTAYANSPSVETVETPVKPSNVSPSLPTQPKNIGIDLDLFNYIPTTEGNKEVYIEELHRRIVHKEGISNLEASFINKLKTCSLDEQILRLKFRYCFGPVNYILDNLGSSGKITGPLHSKLIEIAKKEKCVEGLKFLKENFSAVIYPNYIKELEEAISYIETDIPF